MAPKILFCRTHQREKEWDRVLFCTHKYLLIPFDNLKDSMNFSHNLGIST